MKPTTHVFIRLLAAAALTALLVLAAILPAAASASAGCPGQGPCVVSLGAFESGVTVASHVRVAGRERWHTLSTFTIAGAAGADLGSLQGSSRLAVGSMRVTLTPVGGGPCAITFRVR